MEHVHQYKKISENQDGILEFCTNCKKRLITKKDPKTQRIDNKKYMKEHVADSAQPYGKTGKIFKKFYGEAPKDLRHK